MLDRIKTTSEIYFPRDDKEKFLFSCIWRVSDPNVHTRKETILPKGNAEIIFNLSNLISYIDPSTKTEQAVPFCFINGLNEIPFQLVKRGVQTFIGLQVSIPSLKVIFNTPPAVFNNAVMESVDVHQSLYNVGTRLMDTAVFSEQVDLILAWLKDRIASSRYQSDLKRFYQLWHEANVPKCSVKTLSENSFYSDRHFRRLVSNWFGLNTEQFILYKKYLTALHLIHDSEKTLTDIGLCAGYFDQSHFIREFKAYTHLRPGEYLKVRSDLKGHIFSD